MAEQNDFIFQVLPKRGRLKGSKSKKNLGKHLAATLAGNLEKGNTPTSKKRDCLMIAVDPIEPPES